MLRPRNQDGTNMEGAPNGPLLFADNGCLSVKRLFVRV
jgi:hypothetical protein